MTHPMNPSDEATCHQCGAPVRDHMIGGPAPYHPNPVVSPAPDPERTALADILNAWDKFEAEHLQLDEGVQQAITAARDALRAAPQPSAPPLGLGMRSAISQILKEKLVASTDVDGMPIISGIYSATSAILSLLPAEDGAREVK